MILPQGGASYLGILLSLGWCRLFEAACVPVKTPWDDECPDKSCHRYDDWVRLWCDSDLKTGKNLSEHDIKWVSIGHITSLIEGMFDGFTVPSIAIYGYDLKVLEAGCFDNLDVGWMMTLDEMNMDTLPPEFFRGLDAGNLHITRSKYDRKPRADLFKGVKRIYQLELHYINGLTYLPKDFFQGLDMLRRLWIYPASSLCLPHTIFQPLKQLELIHATGSSLFGMTLCPKIFKGLTTKLIAPDLYITSFVMECNPNMNMDVKKVKDPYLKNCDRNDGCDECDESAILKLTGSGSAVRGRIEDAAVGVVGALSLVAVLISAGN